MGSSGFIPWHNRPAREYPIKRWLRERYGFAVPASALSRYPTRSSVLLSAGWRPFPAKVWVMRQRR